MSNLEGIRIENPKMESRGEKLEQAGIAYQERYGKAMTPAEVLARMKRNAI